jgi:hypothetical protein
MQRWHGFGDNRERSMELDMRGHERWHYRVLFGTACDGSVWASQQLHDHQRTDDGSLQRRHALSGDRQWTMDMDLLRRGGCGALRSISVEQWR